MTQSDIYSREYFLSDRCEGWDRFQEGAGLSRIKEKQVRLLAPRPGMKILDAGCGRGEVLLACARAGAEVAGIDYADAAIEISRETLSQFPSAELRQGEVTALPWPEATFDRILFGDVIEHLAPGDAASALGELRRVLRPGGFLLVHTSPNRVFLEFTWPIVRQLLKSAGHGEDVQRMDDWIVESRQYHPNEQTLHRLRRVLRDAGFSTVHAWVDPEVLRGGQHRLTSSLAGGGLGRVVARIASWRPLRIVLGNDLYAVGQQ